MAIFNFHAGFFLLLADGSRLRFDAGRQAVPDEVADHPYILANGEAVADQANDPAPVVDVPPTPEPDGDPSSPADSDPVTTDPEPDEKAALAAEAEALGIDVDKRWGIARLKAEIAKAAA